MTGEDRPFQLPADPSISSPRTYDANLGPTRAILVHIPLGLRLFVGYAAQELPTTSALPGPAQTGETGAESSVHHRRGSELPELPFHGGEMLQRTLLFPSPLSWDTKVQLTGTSSFQV